MLTVSDNHSPSHDISPMIILEDVAVRYRVPTERIGTFKEFAIRLIQRKVSFRYFWALGGIGLIVNKGEVFGLIGNNGAGKSTTLKVISRVLRPTKGRVQVFGKIAPLLELGAGFHSELTGRENVYLNGALLGYSHQQMDQVFQDIVEFSELGPFMDAPIRTYSSGMYARLGFSVATAHQPEILILDEILSVGDEAFQAKCRERMRGFRQNGATILMVSHGLSMMAEMCNRVGWLDHGKLRMVGEPSEVIAAYRQENS
jgi:ABC-2 type transport system ATP-binding protein